MNPTAVGPPARPVTPTTILARELDETCRALSAVAGVDTAIVERLSRARDLAAGLDPYLDQCTSAESAALADLAARTRATDWTADASGGGRLEQEMLSGHVEGQVLKFLVHLASARRVLEIGMFTGYSALAMAEELPADGELVACEIDSAVADFARAAFSRSEAGRKIIVAVGPAADTLRRLAAEAEADSDRRFDFVFVDADKGSYRQYVDVLLDSGLLTPRAVIAVDNTLMQGEPYLGGPHGGNGRAIAEFNATLTEDPRVEQVLLPLRDGLTLIRRARA